MKVLVINGSPRGENGNTMHLTRAFLEGAKWTDAEIIDVCKLDIKGCIGCFTCWTKTPGECVLKDDMKNILPKIIAADVVIWSYPLYYFNVPGQLKIFIDRQLPLVLPEMSADTESGGHPSRYDFSKQRHFHISTCGFWTAEGNYDSIKVMYKRIEEDDKYTMDSIFVGQGELFKLANYPNADEIEQLKELKQLVSPYMETVRRAGAEWAAGSISEETRRILEQPLLPQEVYEESANSSW